MASPNVLASRSVTQNFPAGVSVGQTLTWDGNFWAPGAGSGTVVADVDPVAAPPAEGMFGWNRVAKSLWIYDATNGWVKLIGCLLALLFPCSMFAADTGGSIQRNFATTNDAPTLTNIVIALGTGGTGVAVAVNTNAVAVTNGSVVTISGVTDTNAVRGLVSAATNYAALVVGVGATNYTIQATNDAAVNARAYANAATNSLGTNNRLVPALPSDATQFLNGTGAFSVPAGGGGSGTLGTTNTTFYVTTVGSITFQGTNGVVLGTWTNGNFVIGTNLYVVGSLNVGSSSVTSTTGSTNTFTFSNPTTAQILAQFGTNGLTILGTNGQFKLDTSGNVVITGSYYGLDTSLTNAGGLTLLTRFQNATNEVTRQVNGATNTPAVVFAASNDGNGNNIFTQFQNATNQVLLRVGQATNEVTRQVLNSTNSPAVVFRASNISPGALINPSDAGLLTNINYTAITNLAPHTVAGNSSGSAAPMALLTLGSGLTDSGGVLNTTGTGSATNAIATVSTNGVSVGTGGSDTNLDFWPGITEIYWWITNRAGHIDVSATVSNLPNASLVNSAITINGSSTALGGTAPDSRNYTNGGFSLNQIARSNIVDQIQTWPTSTNQLVAIPGSTSWLIQSATPTAQTNISGTLSATQWVFQSLVVSNSTAAAFTNWITIPAAKAVGYAATNDVAVLGGNMTVIPASSYKEILFKVRLGQTNWAVINP